jgi:epoxide hydrolase-like predicted phosphatase
VTIRAVFFDLGGVIVRTEYQTPREHLAQRLGLSYEDLERAVFASKSSRQASLGEIDTDAHWDAVVRDLGLPPEQKEIVRSEFFAGDVVDRDLIEFLRSLRPTYKTGLISNAWPDLRDYIIRQGFDDAFEQMIISAEVKVMKPEARIYQIALEQAGVRPHEAVFVDDFIENVYGAQTVGMHALHFREPLETLRTLRNLLGLER